MVSGSLSLPDTLGSVTSGGYFFRVTPSNLMLAAVLATRIRGDGANRITIVYNADEYGRDLSSKVADQFTALGGTVIKQVAIGVDDRNFDYDHLADNLPTTLQMRSLPRCTRRPASTWLRALPCR